MDEDLGNLLVQGDLVDKASSSLTLRISIDDWVAVPSGMRRIALCFLSINPFEFSSH
jgi:hypothetical protein